MKHKIKSYILMAFSALMLAMPIAVPVAVSAADAVCSGGNSTIADNVSKGANGAATGDNSSTCATDTNVNDDSLASLGRKIVNLFSLIIGVIAIIMIIYGGFRYITSGGASERVGNAKNTLIYAIVGLIIVALAQIIVHFVLNQTNTAVNGT
jgi:type IV secretion system pilin